MNANTNVQTTAVATFVAALVFWLLGYFQPELMATAPAGLESGLAGVIIAVIGYFVPQKALGGSGK